jgi:branched-chain amino acid transport system permease protein
MNYRVLTWGFWSVLFGTLLLIPQIFGVFNADILVGFGITALFAVSLNMLALSGLFSFGHALFYGVGAYTTGLALSYIADFPIIPALLLGGIVSALFALLLSPLLVRISGIYFTMLTIAFNELAYGISMKFREITGGESGLSIYSVPSLNVPGLGTFDMGDKFSFYYFALAIVVVCIGIMWFVTKTPFGDIMLGIRNNQDRVAYLGFWVPGSKTTIIVISAFFAGIAGSLLILWINVVSPQSCLHLVNVSIKTFLAILVGGLGTFTGPFIGVGVILLFGELIQNYGRMAELIIWWITIFYLLFAAKIAPWGIMGIFTSLKTKISAWLRHAGASQQVSIIPE